MAKIVIVLTLFVVITEARFLDRERDFFQDTSKRVVRIQSLVNLMFTIQMQFYFAIVGLPMRNRENKRYLPIVLLRKMLYCTREQFASFLQGTVAAAPIPFRERSLAFLRVNATIGNQVFSHERCNINLVFRGPLVLLPRSDRERTWPGHVPIERVGEDPGNEINVIYYIPWITLQQERIKGTEKASPIHTLLYR